MQRTVSLFICVCIALCTIVAHNIAQNRPDGFPPYPPDNHHSSDDVYLSSCHDSDAKWQEIDRMCGSACSSPCPGSKIAVLPIEHKLSVVRTFFDRSQSLISDSTDRHAEDLHIEKALRDCGYPDWTFQKVKKQMKIKPSKRKQRGIQQTGAWLFCPMWRVHPKGQPG